MGDGYCMHCNFDDSLTVNREFLEDLIKQIPRNRFATLIEILEEDIHGNCDHCGAENSRTILEMVQSRISPVRENSMGINEETRRQILEELQDLFDSKNAQGDLPSEKLIELHESVEELIENYTDVHGRRRLGKTCISTYHDGYLEFTSDDIPRLEEEYLVLTLYGADFCRIPRKAIRLWWSETVPLPEEPTVIHCMRCTGGLFGDVDQL